MEQFETKTDVCDVHRWALSDFRPREVYYCGLCDAWICAECDGNIPRRAKATVNRAKAKLKAKMFDRDFQ